MNIKKLIVIAAATFFLSGCNADLMNCLSSADSKSACFAPVAETKIKTRTSVNPTRNHGIDRGGEPNIDIAGTDGIDRGGITGPITDD